MKIILPGGSGQVGRLLARHFCAHGHEVVVLGRGAGSTDEVDGARKVAWDGVHAGPWTDEIDGADVVINLAGRSVDCRYNATNRAQIIDSRVDSTRAVGAAIRAARRPPPVWLQASTATIYAHSTGQAHDETSGVLGDGASGAPDKWKFSVDVAKRWEAALDEHDLPATRRVALRSAMTMSPDAGGIFDVLLRLVRFGLGGSAGDGKQYVSWIHGQDFVRAIDRLIEDERFTGPVNLSAPEPLPYREFMRTLRQAYGRRIGLPATRWMIEIGTFLMRTESELVLKSRRVVPGVLQANGFEFDFPNWSAAAQDLCQRWKTAHDRRGI